MKSSPKPQRTKPRRHAVDEGNKNPIMKLSKGLPSFRPAEVKVVVYIVKVNTPSLFSLVLTSVVPNGHVRTRKGVPHRLEQAA